MGQLGPVWRKVPLFWRIAGPGLLLALAAVALVQGRPDGRLHLFFFPVGQGNGVLLVSPSGRTVLIDGGPDATGLLEGLGRVRPFWARTLDLALLTEAASERLAGPVAALERYPARAAGRPVRWRASPGYDRWETLLRKAGVTALPLAEGSRFGLGDGVTIEVLYPGTEPLPGVDPGGRDDALVVRLRYGQFCALLPTAAGPAGQQALLRAGAGLSCAVLLVPRQAGAQALERRFLEAVRPALAVVSAGSGRYEGPDARVLSMLSESGAAIYRTDRQGTVEVITDGVEVWVRTAR